MAGTNDDQRPTLDDLEAEAAALGLDHFAYLGCWAQRRAAARSDRA